jgi:hypothetical protein
MNAYKFHVDNYQDSKRHQDILFKLGYCRQDGETSYLHHKTQWLTANPDGVIGFTNMSDCVLYDVPYKQLDYETLKRML